MNQTRSNKEFSEQMKRRIYKLILETIKFVESLPQNDSICRVVRDQLIRSITSMGAS